MKILIKPVLKKIKRTVEKHILPKARFGQKYNDISIISNNCIAGYVYKDLYIPYNSPTIGLQFTQAGFVDFCKNFSYYTQLPITEHPNPSESENEFRALGGKKIDFPIGKLGDLTLFLQHYGTIEEAATAWDRRRQRINNSKLFFIFMAYDNTEKSIVKNFESLSIKNSLTLSINRNFSTTSVNLLCDKAPWYSYDSNAGKPYYWKFDYIKWIKESMKK